METNAGMKTKLAIMQPYFFPYIGYYQLINYVDVFVLYDNIKYTKKGWINRNRFLLNGKPEIFTLPLRTASDALNVVDREIAPTFRPMEIINKLTGAYRRAPEFDSVIPFVTDVLNYPQKNLFDFLYNSISMTSCFLGLTTKFVVSSSIKVVTGATKTERLIEMCSQLSATDYVNPIGGTQLYSKGDFDRRSINLSFLKSTALPYPQFHHSFVPALSILDVLMFNPLDKVRRSIQTEFLLT